MGFSWNSHEVFQSKMNEEWQCRQLRRARTMHQVFRAHFYLKIYSSFTLQKKKNQLHLKCLLLTKSCKTPIERKSLFFECISDKLSNQLTFLGIVWTQVHVCTMQHSTEMEVCFPAALGTRPSFICIWKIHTSVISLNCLVVFLQ